MSSAPVARVDHVLVAVPDLAASMVSWRAAGYTPRVGGRHPGGTANALVRGPEAAYLELISAESGHGDETTRRIAALRGPAAWALGVSDIHDARARLAVMGIPAGPVRPGSRTTPAGEILRWQVCDIAEQPIDPVIPFLIQWDVSMTPGPEQGPRIRRLTVGCRNVGQTARLLAACGLEHLDGDRPGEATLTDGTVVVVLSPDGDGIRSVDLHAADTEGSTTVLDGLRIQPFADE